jgi:hypothetical protein
LPVPVSPLSSTVALLFATVVTCAMALTKTGASPTNGHKACELRNSRSPRRIGKSIDAGREGSMSLLVLRLAPHP